ncbi:MAG: ClpXP protease specificity-enhancing factor [Pseudomonadota bacterium]
MTNTSRSKRPYLVRAMHQWMVDNGNTPHIVVNATADGVAVPIEHVKDGKIILNISDTAAHNLKLGNDAVSFRARFGGVPYDVWVPMRGVMGIYARETGQGMIFSHDSDTVESTRKDSSVVAEASVDDDIESTRARSHLRVIK